MRNFIGSEILFAMGGGKVVLWDRTIADDRVIHIHGDLDDVFPMRCYRLHCCKRRDPHHDFE
jgi:hypothetical protein